VISGLGPQMFLEVDPGMVPGMFLGREGRKEGGKEGRAFPGGSSVLLALLEREVPPGQAISAWD